MKKIILSISLLFLFIVVFPQNYPIVNRTTGSNTVNDPRLQAGINLFAPRYLDTTAANVQKGMDSCGAIIYTYNINTFWLRGCSPKRWIQVVSGSVETTDSLFGKQDNLFTGNRSVNQASFNMSIVNGNFGLGSTSPTRTLSIGSPGGVETGVLYTPDGTVLRFETRNSAGMSIIAGSQISMQPAAASGQLVFNGMTSNYITQDWYTGGGEKIGEMGLSVYNALLGESQFYLKANNVDTTVTYLVLYDKMKFANIPNDDATTKIITIDADDNVRYRDVSSISGGGGGLSGGNLGIGYRYYVPSLSGIKSSIADNGLSLDSIASNILTYKLGGTLTQNTTINQSTFSLSFPGSGQLAIGNTVSGSQARVTISNPTSGTQHLMVGSNLHSNNVYTSFYTKDTLTTASFKSTGVYNRYQHFMSASNITVSGWSFGSDWMFDVPDSMRLNPVGSDLAAGAIIRSLMQPNTAYTGSHRVQQGLFKDDYVGGIVGAIQNDNTNTTNWIYRRGFSAGVISHYITGGTKDSADVFAGFFSTALNSGRILRANQFYAGPIGNVDSLFAFYAPYDAHNYMYGSLRLGGDVAGNSYAAAISAKLDIATTTKGILIPRLTQTQESAISSPAPFLMLINTDSSRMRIRIGSAYQSVAFLTDIPSAGGGGSVTNVATGYGLSGGPITTTGTLLFDSATVFTQLRAQFWTVGGNTAVAGSQTGSWLGTLNNVQIRIRTNNIERAVWDSAITQLRIGGATRNSDDGIIVTTPGIGNYDGITVYSNGGTTPTTYAYAGIERGGGFTIKMTSSNASITPTLYIGGEFGSAPDRITIAAGTTSIAPFQMASSSLTTGGNIRGGQFTYLSDKFYGAITTGPAHKEFTLNDAALTSGRVPYTTTNGRLIDASTFTTNGANVGIGGSFSTSSDLLISGTAATLNGLRVLSTIIPTVGGDAYGIYSNPTMTEAGSSTHGIFATLRLAGPNVTAGAGALTRTAAIYMADNSNGVVTDANYAIYSLLIGPSVFNGDLSLATTGNKLSIATGSNASIGTSGALSGGSVTVSTTVVTANSKIFLTHATLSGTQGILSVGTITTGTSFVINSSSGTDAGTVNWWIIN